jgi:diadenosine tetraphosphate (Ap4A) HIT family hydrolase
LHDGRDHVGVPLQLIPETVIEERPSCEWSLLRLELRRLVPALDRLFQPDQLNFAFLMNQDAQVHLHVVPRYASPRQWHDREFADAHWGSAFGDEQRALDRGQLKMMAEEIRAQLPRDDAAH